MQSSAIRDILVQHGEKLLARPARWNDFTENPGADSLLNDLDGCPHAFVIACLMDRRWAAEKCWMVPYRFKNRCGSFEIGTLAALPRQAVLAHFVKTPPLHLMKEVMAGIFHAAVQRIRTQYGGNAARIWQGRPSSATIVRRLLEFDGAGQKIATMAANILVRDFKIPVSDRFSIDVSVDRQVRRTFKRLGLVRQDASDAQVIYVARELNPTYPGVFDLSVWEIGRKWCHPTQPECGKCYLRESCPTARHGRIV